MEHRTYAQWQLACNQGREKLLCHQYEMSEADSLIWILLKARPHFGINAFNRVQLALDLEPYFKKRALFNQQVGGAMKGASNLTEADRLDVRQEVAVAAGVSVGNVSKVKQIMLGSVFAESYGRIGDWMQ